MSDKSNPYLAFVDAEEVPHTNVATPAKVETPVVVEDKPEPREDYYVNPYLSFLGDEEEKSLLEKQPVKEAMYGAVAGAAYKAHQMRADAKNAPRVAPDMNKPMSSRGLQSYLNSQINAKYSIPLKRLEEITGKPIRTMAEVQQAVKFIQGEPVRREPIADVSGKKVPIYRTTPGREPYDLKEFERTLGKQLISTAKAAPPVLGGMGRGAVAGAAMLPMAVQMTKQEEPTDWTQWSSLIGSGLGLTRSGPLTGLLGLGMQAPYIAKHAQEISSGLGLGEINPTVFGGAPEALETPIK